ncbi:hypothetical protein Micbo1qcDRAFT_174860 [Microdochium bolleyi]|uniref:Uncharacterized protein n=1 Tax=Microdochium bolleyi TaxID=196109 RepID=A0A136J3L9_9PEZI|nr:hypothetical protein Micbo1qcDRAFT_174860 [Microdochium bolleyi]
MHTTTLALIFSVALSQVAAYDITFWANKGCRSGAPVHWMGGPNQGCRQDWLGTYASAMVKSTGSVDDNFMLVFFSSPDCNPDTIIWNGDENTGGCIEVNNAKSFEVWDLS